MQLEILSGLEVLKQHIIIIINISNRALFSCLYSLIQTRGGLGEFETVVQARDVVEVQNVREFSQPSECLDEAI